MISLAVDMKRRPTLLHFPLAVHAFHESLLIRNPESHSSVSGTYVGARAASVPMSRGALWARQAQVPAPRGQVAKFDCTRSGRAPWAVEAKRRMHYNVVHEERSL